MDASSFPIIPLLLPFPHRHITDTTTATHSPAAHDEEQDDEDILSLCDLPLHNSSSNNINQQNHLAAASPALDADDEEEDGFEFSREYSFTADQSLDATTTKNRDNDLNNSIVFCGKLIAHRQLAVQQQDKVKLMNVNEKKRKKEEGKKQSKKKQSSSSRGRIFPWKSFSSSSSSSSSNSSSSSASSSPGRKKKKKGTGAGRWSARGYLCLAIGVEWKLPVRSMDLKDIKLRQSRRSSSTSLDFDVSTSSSSSSSMLPENTSAVGSKSGKGLWCLLRVLAGARP
ncbi:unnamed protein product [Linum trigynum]|uniref:Uncharacterized protein n=1 Tax=Linum trigynum TaxID=586398 RepID=A0AAV2EN32_9ROSI